MGDLDHSHLMRQNENSIIVFTQMAKRTLSLCLHLNLFEALDSAPKARLLTWGQDYVYSQSLSLFDRDFKQIAFPSP